jgi:5-methylcytosine-specific restriction endonuclease McrA
VKREVRARDGDRCTYVSPDGTRCERRWQLELDHVVPVGKGGASTIDNVRLRCKSHNTLAAEEHYGRELMLRCRGRSPSRTGEPALAGESDRW